MSTKKKSALEDAIQAANLENYVFVKRDDIKPQTQNVNKKSSENITPKVVHEEPKKANLPVIESSIQIEPQKLEKLSENKTTIPNPNNLYSLFQQEISELLSNGHDENPSNEEKNMHHFQKHKKTRWDKPIVVPPNFIPSIGFQIPPENNFRQAPNRFTPIQTKPENKSKMEEEKPSKQDSQIKGGEMSNSLSNYVKKSFEKCQNDKERQIIEKALKKILNNAKLRGEYETRNWDNCPIPLLPREAKNSGSVFGFQEEDLDEKVDLQNKKKIVNQPIKEESAFEFGVNENGKKIIKTAAKQPNKGLQIEFSKEEEEKRKARQGRFHDDFQKKSDTRFDFLKSSKAVELETGEGDDLDTLAEKWKVVGTSTALEKPYLRLTKEPDPSTIRPESVLKQSLKMLLDKWAKKEANYAYIAEQFRSIRQDLNVQHIKNKFTVKVYESNARISLESNDINYFNQCQSRLKDFYRTGLPTKNKAEFLSYRIIYLTLCEMKVDLCETLEELTDEELNHEYVQFALEMRNHYEIGNIKGFFNMYKNGINLVHYLIELFLIRVRIWALKIVTKSFGEKIALPYLADLLAFSDEESLKEFIISSDGVLTEDKSALNNKESFKIYNDHPWMKLKLKILKHF